MTDFQDDLREEYTIDTPENVSFGYEVAGIGSRFIGALFDTTIVGILLVLLNVALTLGLSALSNGESSFDLEGTENWGAGLLVALYALLNFAVIWGYFICFEWLNQGQTPGKRVANIRVVQLDGSPVGVLSAVIRNFVRVIDFLPGGYGLGLIVMFLNNRSRRLGDFAAGTLVVRAAGELQLADVLMPSTSTHPEMNHGETSSTEVERSGLPTPPAIPFDADSTAPTTMEADWHGVRRLSAADFELVQQTLQRRETERLDPMLVQRVARAIATKMGVLPSSYAKLATESVETSLAHQFLEELAAAYPRWVR